MRPMSKRKQLPTGIVQCQDVNGYHVFFEPECYRTLLGATNALERRRTGGWAEHDANQYPHRTENRDAS